MLLQLIGVLAPTRWVTQMQCGLWVVSLIADVDLARVAVGGALATLSGNAP
jgi:hypothetical protein